MGEKLRFESEWPIIIQAGRRNNLDEDDMQILLAMREAEAGPLGNEFGEMPVKGTNLDKQAGWAAAGIKKNRERYLQFLRDGVYKGSRREVKLEDLGENPDFYTFMAQYGGPTGYGRTPIHSPELSEEHRKINEPWPNNIKSTLQRVRDRLKEKGMSDEFGISSGFEEKGAGAQ